MGSLNLDRYRFLDHAEDSIQIGNGTDFLSIDGSGYITANINGTVTVDAVNLDIRDLTHASDSIQIGNGTTFLDIETDGSINVNIASDADDAAMTKNPLAVGSKAYDQASVLSALSAAGDAGFFAMDLYRRQFVNDAPTVGWSCEAIAVSTTALQLDATKQEGRTKAIIQNLGTKRIAVGPDASTTFANGLVIGKWSNLVVEIGEALDIYAIGDTGASSEDIRIAQFG